MRIELAQKNLLSSALSLERISNPDSDALSANAETTGWVTDSPGTFVIDETFYYLATAFNLKVSNPSQTNMILRGTQSSVPYPYVAEELIFHALIFCETDLNVLVYLHPSDSDYTTVTPNTQTLIAGKWSPVFSNSYTFGDELSAFASAEITLVIQTLSSLTPVFFTLPTLTLNEPQKYNQFSQLSKNFFPDIFREVDQESTNPINPLAKIYHSMTADLSQAMDKYVRMVNLERPELNTASVEIDGDPFNTLTRSELTDPELMVPEYLEWGAMLRGALTISDIQVGGVSVLPSGFDFRRWQVQTGAFGHDAGSRESVREAVQTILTGSRTVLITPLWQGQQFNIMIRTLVSETPDNPAVGQSSPKVLAVAKPTRPAGYVFLHQTLATINFILGDPDFGLFDVNTLE